MLKPGAIRAGQSMSMLSGITDGGQGHGYPESGGLQLVRRPAALRAASSFIGGQYARRGGGLGLEHAVASLFHGRLQAGAVNLAGRVFDGGLLGGQVHGGPLHAGRAAEGLLHEVGAGGAGHALDVEGFGARGRRGRIGGGGAAGGRSGSGGSRHG